VGEILNVTVELLRRGHKESEVEAIWGGNIMRVFEQVARAAEG
jgi:membrane dipeptidase